MPETALFAELVTVRDFLRFAVTRFGEAGLAYGHGTASALDDAAFLILETLHLPIGSLEPWLDARLTRAERVAIGGVIENRVVSRLPSAYLTKSAYIGPHRFVVDPRVIVPRSFIGELLCADDDLPLGLEPPPARILDLCTGSGCLAIIAAHAFPDATVLAADVSRDALAVADDNIRRHGLSGRVTTRESDLLAGLGRATFDLIVCNPPYVTAAAVADFPPEYRAEPVLAHAGGADGMDLVRRVLNTVGGYLAPHGTLILELGRGRSVIERDYPDLPFLWLDTEHSSGEVLMLGAQHLPAGPALGAKVRATTTSTGAKTARKKRPV